MITVTENITVENLTIGEITEDSIKSHCNVQLGIIPADKITKGNIKADNSAEQKKGGNNYVNNK